MINLRAFTKAGKAYEKQERRVTFFKLAKNLLKHGFEVEGMLMILTTWNFAIFRYVTKTFDIDNFRKKLSKLAPYFHKLSQEDFRTIKFDKYKREITIIYNSLANIKGIEHTGAPKIMHLKNPELFVMWDAFIRGDKPKKYYSQLDMYKNGNFIFKRYPKTAEGYIEFLKEMQTKFADTPYSGDRPFAKAIDEFNYFYVTIPLQKLMPRRAKVIEGDISWIDS